MLHVDVIIPCYGKPELINRGLASLAVSWKKEFIHVTMVNDCSPHTDNNYQELVDRYKNEMDIRCIKTPKNVGQGLARQFGIDNTTNDYFMFMDEDDQYCPLAISQIVGAVEGHGLKLNSDGTYNVNKKGKPIYHRNIKKVAVVSAPLFEFDDQHTHIITSENRIWLNAKVYRREFVEKYNIRFNEAQSRHAEDYYWGSCFFHCLDNDPSYVGILLGNEGLYYLWYPNESSQSRIDPHYGYMLSGYTMDGSLNILKFIRDNKNIPWSDDIEEQYSNKLLNMTVYSFFTFLSFIRRVATTDYIPKLEEDWTILRDACDEMRKMFKENYHKYSYMRKIEEINAVKNFTDVQYTEPWITFDDYIKNGMQEFNWSFKTLLECKKTYKFDAEGIRLWD